MIIEHWGGGLFQFWPIRETVNFFPLSLAQRLGLSGLFVRIITWLLTAAKLKIKCVQHWLKAARGRLIVLWIVAYIQRGDCGLFLGDLDRDTLHLSPPSLCSE